MTKASEFREMHDDELENRLAEASQELFNLRFQHVTGQLDNYARIGQVKRDVARIRTLLREREIEAAEAEEAAEEAAERAAEAADDAADDAEKAAEESARAREETAKDADDAAKDAEDAAEDAD